jgi:hypothetical protein
VESPHFLSLPAYPAANSVNFNNITVAGTKTNSAALEHPAALVSRNQSFIDIHCPGKLHPECLPPWPRSIPQEIPVINE